MFCECWLSYLYSPMLGETVLSDDFLGRSCKQPDAFRKLKIMSKLLCSEEKHKSVGFFGRFEATFIQLLLVEDNASTERAQFPSSQRHVIWLFKSRVKTHLGNIVPFQESKGQGRVFCECWLPYLLLLWLNESELSVDIPARIWKHPFYFIKCKILNSVL